MSKVPFVTNRPAFRLKGRAYNQSGGYFVTVNTKNRKPFFGRIENDRMVLNQQGTLADSFWREISNHYPHVILDEHVVMPEHIHGILQIDNTRSQSSPTVLLPSTYQHVTPKSISVIINQFKGMVTKACRSRALQFEWQPRFHDHIIRSPEEFERIRSYIKTNPANYKKGRNQW